MVKIIITSPNGKSRFAYEFVEIDEAKKFLDVLRVHGFEAAQQYEPADGARLCEEPGCTAKAMSSSHYCQEHYLDLPRPGAS